MRILVTLVGNQVRRAQLILIVVLVLGILYVGFGVMGSSTFRNPYDVTVELEQTGGLMEGSLVNYRGHKIGRVTDVRLTDSGAEATLAIDRDVEVPTDTEAFVLNLSAVGEQYVDLRPRVDHGPYLEDGSVIERGDTSTPLPVSQVLLDLDRMTRHVSADDLETVMDELEIGIGSSADDLVAVLDNGELLLRTLERLRPSTLSIIDRSRLPLTTLVDRRSSLRTFARSMDRITEQLQASDGWLRALLDEGRITADQLEALMEEDDGALARLFANLLVPAEVMADRRPALAATLEALPLAGFALSDIIRLGAVQGKLTTGTAVACDYGTPINDPLEDAETVGNLGRHCPAHSPTQPQRGANFAPRP